jgi:ATP-dependent phosphofructokinase / diphosphate-dependent phosphofructokinase
MSKVRRIGVLTGGGDAPGLNAVIRAVVKSSYNRGIECLGLENSFDGLLETNRHTVLTPRNVTGILRLGGTILGTVNRGNPFLKPIETSDGPKDYADRCMEIFHKLQIDGIVVIGGDGTLSIAHEFNKKGMPIIGVPKTIDNDIVGTTNCFGFDTAVAFATDAIDRLHTTAQAHQRVMVVEVMGRYAGWIALYSGVAGGADVIMIPEIPYDIDIVARRIKERDSYGARFSIVVVAEGAVPKGGKVSLVKAADGGYVERLGGVGHRVAAELERLTGKETRTVVLGHLQRGGSPTSFDRMLATRFGAMAVELLMKGESDRMVAFHPPEIGSIPLADVGGKMRLVPADGDVVRTAKSLGISFGDE